MASKAGTLFIFVIIIHCSCGKFYYVKPEGSECPDTAANSMCRTLLEYTSDAISFDSDNSEFQFLEGVHYLTRIFHMKEIVLLSLIGNTSHSILGTPKVTIECMKEASGLVFEYNVYINIHGILIANCNTMSPLSKAALVFSSFTTVTLTNVAVKNSSGLGVGFLSCGSKVLISNSSFEGNGKYDSHGGNAWFIFEHCDESSLEIRYSNFSNGLTSSTQASGLAITSTSPKLVIVLERIYTTNNTAGNIEIEITNPSSYWNISLVNSVFVGGQTQGEGGFSFKTTSSTLPASFSCFNGRKNDNVLRIENSVFVFNARLTIALQESNCHTESITITNCKFENNANQGYGAAMTIVKHHLPRILENTDPSTKISLTETLFNHNTALSSDSVTEFVNIEKIHFTKCSFTNNRGSAISLINSNLVVSGTVKIENNTAETGAGLKLCAASMIFITEDTLMLFSNNKASKYGGAFQIQDSCQSFHRPCFFQPVINTRLPEAFHELNMVVELHNNTADLAGNSVYGGEIENCSLYWTNWTSVDMFCSLFQFSDTMDNQVSSDAYIVEFCDGSLNHTVFVYPGATFQVPLMTKGQLDGQSPSIVGVMLRSDYNNLVELHAVDDMRTYGTNCTNYSVRFSLINENVKNIEVVFTVKQDNVRRKQNAILTIIFDKCPWGFDLINGSCRCSSFIEGRGFKCDINSLTIRKPVLQDRKLYWCGCRDKSCHDERIVITTGCGYTGYCNPHILNVTENSINNQCNEGRTGIACGSCKDSYSLVLGTNRCVKSCSNRYLGLIALYLLAGVLLMVLIMTLNVTVSKGYLYGLIFYANIVHINQAIFFPSSFRNFDFPRIAIAWLNLDLGIEVCLYNGMTAVQKIWLQIGFVLYLFALQIMVIFLCRFYVSWTRLFGRNATKVISTLILLIFTKVVRLCSVIITTTSMKTSIEDTVLIWQFSGDIQVGSSQHIPLLVMAAVFGMLALLLSLCLLFIQFLLRISEVGCFKWVARLHPFFETFTGPCNSHFIFWPGFLFLLRIALVIFYGLHHMQIFMMPATVAVCIFVAILSVVGPKGVYKQRSLNLLELSLILNTGVISIVATFYKQYFQNITRCSVFIAIACFIVFHLVTNFCRIKKAFRRFKKHYYTLVKKPTGQVFERQRNVSHSEVVVSSESNEYSPIVKALPPIGQYDTFREPLIDSVQED